MLICAGCKLFSDTKIWGLKGRGKNIAIRPGSFNLWLRHNNFPSICCTMMLLDIANNNLKSRRIDTCIYSGDPDSCHKAPVFFSQGLAAHDMGTRKETAACTHVNWTILLLDLSDMQLHMHWKESHYLHIMLLHNSK